MNMPHHSQSSQELSARSDMRLDWHVARFGLRVAASLSEGSEALPQDISERLRFSREQALLKARSARAAQTQAVTGTLLVRNGSSLALNGFGGEDSSRWVKLVSFLPLLLLLAGLLLIQHGQWYEQILTAAEIDTALLSDRLPPAAYGDPGFSEYLSDEQE